MRYIIFNGSITGHCCFTTSVLDTTKPHIIRGKHYEDSTGKHYAAVCECFSVDDARKVCDALNKI